MDWAKPGSLRIGRTHATTTPGSGTDSMLMSFEIGSGASILSGSGFEPIFLSWECVQGVRYGFEGRNGKNRRHLAGDKSFFRLAKRIKSLRHVGASN